MLRDLFSLFPAYAGVILILSGINSSKTTFPRIRGGDPPHAARLLQHLLTFPRIRGGDPVLGEHDEPKQHFSPHTRG